MKKSLLMHLKDNDSLKDDVPIVIDRRRYPGKELTFESPRCQDRGPGGLNVTTRKNFFSVHSCLLFL